MELTGLEKEIQKKKLDFHSLKNRRVNAMLGSSMAICS